MTRWIRGLDERAGRLGSVLGTWTSRTARAYRGVFLVAMLTGLACYGIDLFNLSVSLDEESQATVRGGVIQWVHQDRWGMYLLNAYLLPAPTLPYISVLMGIVGLAVSAVVAVDLWGGSAGDATGGRDARSSVAAAVIVSTPVLVFLMHFNTTQYGAFIGLAAGFVGVRLFVAGGWRGWLAGWVLAVFALSVYQSIGMAVLCVYLFHAINRQLRDPSRDGSLRRLVVGPVSFGLWLAAVAVGHKASSWLARHIVGDEGSYDLIEQAYSGTYWQWYSVDRVMEYIGFYLTGDRWYLGWPTAAVVYGGVFLVLTRLCYRERASLGLVVGVLTLALAVVTPFLLVIGTGVTFWPTRTLLGFPVLLGGLMFTGLGTRSHLARAGYWCVCLVCLGGFVVANCRMLSADQQQWVVDRQFVFEIQGRLGEAGLPQNQATLLAIVGTRRFDPSPGRFEEETIGMSYFSTKMAPPLLNIRIARIMQGFGVSRVYGVAGQNEYRIALDAAASMPVWPDPGSVAFVDNIAVVKLSEPLPAQLRFVGR